MTLPPEGHMHLADQSCGPECEPVERLRCICVFPYTNGEPSICHRRAANEWMLCADCFTRCRCEGHECATWPEPWGWVPEEGCPQHAAD